jgi:hypothetical protein
VVNKIAGLHHSKVAVGRLPFTSTVSPIERDPITIDFKRRIIDPVNHGLVLTVREIDLHHYLPHTTRRRKANPTASGLLHHPGRVVLV